MISEIAKKILYVDMDGVVADFEAGVRMVNPRVIWNQEDVDDTCEMHPYVFQLLPEIPGAISAVNLLKDEYEILFLSTPMCNVPESYTDKRRWLRKKFGEWVDKRLVLTHRKDLAIGDYLIDDRLKNGSENFTGELIHFGTEKYPDWDAVLKYLL